MNVDVRRAARVCSAGCGITFDRATNPLHE
jgi:hypothetical protein